jgi:hypothetical protein
MDYQFLKLTCGVVAIVGLYTVLYRENKFYRFWEHVFLGLASGYSMVFIWSETLKSGWWDKIVGSSTNADGGGATMGYPLYLAILPIGLMGYTVFSKRHNWLSRIPIGIILGFYSGQQINAWQNRYIPQLVSSMKPIFPTTFTLFVPVKAGLTPDQIKAINSNLYPSQAITNIIFIATLLSVLSYFLFSFDVKSKIIHRMSLNGRWLLMIGFGAIFGSTVMMRFTLLIDRMYFIWIEWFKVGLLHR